jgi:hypothetical protein
MRLHASSIEDPPRVAAEMQLVIDERDMDDILAHVFCLLSLSASLMQYQYTGKFFICQPQKCDFFGHYANFVDVVQI